MVIQPIVPPEIRISKRRLLCIRPSYIHQYFKRLFQLFRKILFNINDSGTQNLSDKSASSFLFHINHRLPSLRRGAPTALRRGRIVASPYVARHFSKNRRRYLHRKQHDQVSRAWPASRASLRTHAHYHHHHPRVRRSGVRSPSCMH